MLKNGFVPDGTPLDCTILSKKGKKKRAIQLWIARVC
jgi:hypothetical protein